MKASKALVVVESPTKAKTLDKFLKGRYLVRASQGHVMDLPASAMGIDVEHDFAPKYIVIRKRQSVLKALKADAEQADELWLATDPDREGEAISWHLSQLLGEGKTVRRAVFHEITPQAVEQAFTHPHTIDMDKVNAQQARRILDRLVGYSISPLLWKKVSRGLSAGRVQSVAVRLIVEREREIRAFVPKEYWSIEATLTPTGQEQPFVAQLVKRGEEELEVTTQAQADELVRALEAADYAVAAVSEAQRRRHPLPPFTTSTLQQEAYYKLHFSASRTMRVAQQLYEGIELGEAGAIGLITYMRTDSVRLADEAERGIRRYIEQRFGKKYLPEAPRRYRSRKGAQGAHEAVRPTDVARTPESVKPHLTPEQLKLYQLIWARAIASQMNPAVYAVTTADITAGEYRLRATGTKPLFDGFTAVYALTPPPALGPTGRPPEAASGGQTGGGVTEEAPDDVKKPQVLPPLEPGDPLRLLGLTPDQHFTKPPPRYSDASLVKVLEEKGIGRPSTYAPIIQTILDRNYVQRQGGALQPTELGEVVTDLLTQHFPKILDVQFTAQMEEELDQVEEGALEWTQCVQAFYTPFAASLTQAQDAMQSVKQQVVQTDETCPQCQRPMVIKWGRHGKFMSCSGFPACKFAKPITTGVPCPEPGCAGELVARRSKRGSFYGCSRYPACRHIQRTLNPPAATSAA